MHECNIKKNEDGESEPMNIYVNSKYSKEFTTVINECIYKNMCTLINKKIVSNKSIEMYTLNIKTNIGIKSNRNGKAFHLNNNFLYGFYALKILINLLLR